MRLIFLTFCRGCACPQPGLLVEVTWASKAQMWLRILVAAFTHNLSSWLIFSWRPSWLPRSVWRPSCSNSSASSRCQLSPSSTPKFCRPACRRFACRTIWQWKSPLVTCACHWRWPDTKFVSSWWAKTQTTG